MCTKKKTEYFNVTAYTLHTHTCESSLIYHSQCKVAFFPFISFTTAITNHRHLFARVVPLYVSL